MEGLLNLLDQSAHSTVWLLEHVGKRFEPLTLSGRAHGWHGPARKVDDELLEHFEEMTLEHERVVVVIEIDGPPKSESTMLLPLSTVSEL